MENQKPEQSPIKPIRQIYSVPDEVKEIWEEMDYMKKKGIERKIQKVILYPFDELEIITPKDYYVLGCNPKGQLIIGETEKSPEFIKTVGIAERRRVYIPLKLFRDLEITTDHIVQVYRIGDGIFMLPIKEMEETIIGRCAECGKSLRSLPRRCHPCTTIINKKTFFFCTKTCRKTFRKKFTITKRPSPRHNSVGGKT